ncbi:MAG: hypothetical protein NT010_10085 [Proteobacteria bacterium]|nr:hypothetical protein [Pseudomonadota bacterium]
MVTVKAIKHYYQKNPIHQKKLFIIIPLSIPWHALVYIHRKDEFCSYLWNMIRECSNMLHIFEIMERLAKL